MTRVTTAPMTINELRSTWEYQNLTPKQRVYVEAFLLTRNSVAAVRIAYRPKKRDTLYTTSKRNRRNPRIQMCIGRFDVESKNGALTRLKEAVWGKRKLSRRIREDMKFILKYQMRERERPLLTEEEKVMLFEPETIQ